MIPSTTQEVRNDLQTDGKGFECNMNGHYAVVMDGFDAGGAKDRVGYAAMDGSGKLVLNGITNANGVITAPIILSRKLLGSENGRPPLDQQTSPTTWWSIGLGQRRLHGCRTSPRVQISGNYWQAKQ